MRVCRVRSSLITVVFRCWSSVVSVDLHSKFYCVIATRERRKEKSVCILERANIMIEPNRKHVRLSDSAILIRSFGEEKWESWANHTLQRSNALPTLRLFLH